LYAALAFASDEEGLGQLLTIRHHDDTIEGCTIVSSRKKGFHFNIERGLVLKREIFLKTKSKN
jgi:hypothetical protein